MRKARPKSLMCCSEMVAVGPEREAREEADEVVEALLLFRVKESDKRPVFSAYRRATAASVSNTIPIAPAPRTRPVRRLSKGIAASATVAAIDAAPNARNPDPSQGINTSPEALSE